MLTPVDIQQKKFHVGLGYDKKDVNTFFDSVSENYEKLYRSNAELKEKVSVLNDTLQNYRSKEENLQKSLKLAEKDTVEAITKATNEAKSIVRDAKNQAKSILSDAESRLEMLQDEIAVLEARYTAYKSNFCTLLSRQFEFLGQIDFDPKSMIDDRAWSLIGETPKQQESASVSDNFGAYTGDPQMRDESTLSGAGLNGGFGSGDVTSTSAVYTQSLSAGENFVDPFKPKEEKEYNPFEKSDKKETSESKLRVSDSSEAKKRMKRATVGSTEASAAMQKAKEVAEQASKKQMQEAKEQESNQHKENNELKENKEIKDNKEIKEERSTSEHSEPEKPQETRSSSESEITEEKISSIPTIQEEAEKDDIAENTSEENLEGEVEEKNGPALLGEGDDDSETDDDGFEFI